MSTQRVFDVNNCPQHVNTSMWGIWIDGRNSGGGENAYGKDYAPLDAFEKIYSIPLDRKLDVQLFLEIKHSLQQKWRHKDNPIYLEVANCHKEVIPAAQVKKIMSTVSVLDNNYCQEPIQTTSCHNQLSEEQYTKAIAKLFQDYSNEVKPKVSGNPSDEQVLNQIGVLMQNLAYLHPLQDRNGRSRLLLLQYILRQQGIACGTMMYNNNKNIYFETVPEVVGNIKEGIEKYVEAQNSDFAFNPWVSKEESHFHNFPPRSWDADLTACWKRQQDRTGCHDGTVPCFHNGTNM